MMNENGTILSFANFCTLILLLIQKHNKKASERERKKRFRRKERKDAVVAKGGKAAPCGYLAKSMIMLPFSFRPSGLNLSVETRLRHAKVLRRLRMIIGTEIRSLFS